MTSLPRSLPRTCCRRTPCGHAPHGFLGVPGCAGGARAGAPPPPPLPSKGALGKRPPSQAAPQSGPSAPDQAALVAGPTPSKPMVKLFWDKLPDRQVCLRE